MKDILAEYKRRMCDFKRKGLDMVRAREFVLDRAGFGPASVLEVGTGKGCTAAGLALRKVRFTTIDLDADALKVARKHLKAMGLMRYVVFKKMDAEKLKFKDGAFDCVISVNFLHHARHPEKCIRQMCRVAARKVVIADLNRRGAGIMSMVHSEEGGSHAKSLISAAAIKAVLIKAGMRVKKYRDSCQYLFVAEKERG
ncbi:MAG: methyltransferase domain-containing protein [Candidatus Omnitrophota bacterium]